MQSVPWRTSPTVAKSLRASSAGGGGGAASLAFAAALSLARASLAIFIGSLPEPVK